MKSEIVNKDNYSLHNSENYKSELQFNLDEAIQKYSQLIIEYFKFIMENIKTNNAKFAKFIIIRGLDTITNVFLYILHFTKNIALTYFHSQKSYYFYIEFVGQIADDEKTFLQLTSKDATTYVYKKTIYDINNEFKKQNEEISTEFKKKIDIIRSYITLYQTYLLKIINLEKIDVNYIVNLSTLSEKINNLKNKSNIILLENITEKLYCKIENIDIFFKLNNLLVTKFLKNQEIIKKLEKKINSYEFNDKLLELGDSFINWFLV